MDKRKVAPRVLAGRGLKFPRPNNIGVMNKVDIEVALKLRDELSKLQLAVVRAKREKQTLEQDKQRLSGTLGLHHKEVESAEKQVKSHRGRAEDVRSELMLAEFKRDTAQKDLDRLLADIQMKRRELDQLDAESTNATAAQRAKEERLRKSWVAHMTAERDALEQKLQSLESVGREREELERQLQVSKENIITEQKRMREQHEGIKEDLEVAECKAEDARSELDSTNKKAAKLEKQLKQMEKDKNEIIQDKQLEYQELQSRSNEQLSTLRSASSREAQELRRQLQEATERLAALQTELHARQDQNTQHKEQLVAAQADVERTQQQYETLQQEQRNSMQAMHADQEAAMSQLVKEAEDSKHHALEQLARDMERDQQHLVSETEHKLMDQLTELQGQVTAREVELEVLRDKLQHQEGLGKQLMEKIRSEAQQRFRQLVDDERRQWQEEKEADVSRQVAALQEDSDRVAQQLRDELSSERTLVETQLRQVTMLKKELEDARCQSRLALREKLNAQSKAETSVSLQKEKQYDLMRERIESETHKSVEQLRETVRRHEEEVTRLQQENARLRGEHDTDRYDKSLLAELNDECRKIAQVLCTPAKVVTLSNYTKFSPGKHVNPNFKAAVGTALTNLKASTEDACKQVGELKKDLHAHKQALKVLERGQKEDLSALRHKLQKEKLQALETLKDRLIQEHCEEVDKLHKSLGKGKTLGRSLREKDTELQEIQKNMKQWKSQQTERIANEFQEEMTKELEKRLREYKRQQREWEREKAAQQREIERLERELQARASVTNAIHRNSQIYGTPMRAPPRPNSSLGLPLHSSANMSFSAASEKEAALLKSPPSMKPLHPYIISDPCKLNGPSKLSTSVPDIQAALNSTYTEGMHISPKPDERGKKLLEMQVSRAENRAKMAESRCDKQESLLNQKLLELSKLQGTLTHQSKELMQLERAYSQLHTASTGTHSSRVDFR